MALVNSGIFGSSPSAAFELYEDQTWGGGTQRTITLTLKLKVSGAPNSKYGYPLNWKAIIGNVSSDWMWVKGNEFWYGSEGYRTYSWSSTIDVQTTSSTRIPVGFRLDMTVGSSSWETSQTGTFTVSGTNVPPTVPSNLVIRENNSSGRIITDYFSENINTLYIKWNPSTDANGDTIYYDLQEQVNNGGWNSIDKNGTDTEHQTNIGNVEGTVYKYWVDARDTSGAHSGGGVYSNTITKNTFTMAEFTSNSQINYNSNNISFEIKGWKNTQKGVGTNFSLSCEGIKVYGGENVSSPCVVNIKRGSTVSNPYIEWNDLIKLFGNENKKGRGSLKFILRGRNSNGTTKTATKNINVNLLTEPNPISDFSISTDTSKCPAYKIIEGKGYYIPNSTSWIHLQWNGLGSGKIGDSVSYKVFISYDDGWWEEIGTVPQGKKTFDHIFSKALSSSSQVKYMVRTISSFNSSYFTDKETGTVTLHYYNPPSILVNSTTRTASYADINVSIIKNTSLPITKYTGNWSATNGQSGDLQSTYNAQAFRITSLVDNKAYNITINIKDTTGLSTTQTTIVNIGANLPLFFVNNYGIGVGGLKANSEISANVKGLMSVDRLRVNGKEIDPYSGGDYLPLSGGSLYGSLNVDNVIKANRYAGNSNAAALTVNKSGPGSFGIGGNGNYMEIQYGQTDNMEGYWSYDQSLVHNFKGTVKINDYEVMKSKYVSYDTLQIRDLNIDFPDVDTAYYYRLKIFCGARTGTGMIQPVTANDNYTLPAWMVGEHFELIYEFCKVGMNMWVCSSQAISNMRYNFNVDSYIGGDGNTAIIPTRTINSIQLKQYSYNFQKLAYILEWRSGN